MNCDRSVPKSLAIRIYEKSAENNTQVAREENTHDPGISPDDAKAFIMARATARLDGGRGNELLIQV